jgi:hypothetical protein
MYYLAYLKTKGMQQFQAPDQDDVIFGLRRMGLLKKHEDTATYMSRYEVPQFIWNELKEPEGDLKNRFLRMNHPWIKESSRI